MMRLTIHLRDVGDEESRYRRLRAALKGLLRRHDFVCDGYAQAKEQPAESSPQAEDLNG